MKLIDYRDILNDVTFDKKFTLIDITNKTILEIKNSLPLCSYSTAEQLYNFGKANNCDVIGVVEE